MLSICEFKFNYAVAREPAIERISDGGFVEFENVNRV